MSETNQTQATATLRFIGQEKSFIDVPADILARALTGLQQIIYLFAASIEKLRIEKRFRVPENILKLYTLHCLVPQVGSFAIPVSLKSSFDNETLPIFDDNNHIKIFNKIYKFLEILSNYNVDNIQDILPDSKLAKRALLEARKFLPKSDEFWQLGFSLQNDTEVVVNNKAISHINDWLAQDIPENTVMTVTGELIKIDFDKNIIFLRYPPTMREIECSYVEDLEDFLLENRRQMIQLTGNFTLDNQGHPINLTDVTRIEAVDLSTIVIQEIPLPEKKLVFKNPLRLVPTMDEESQQLFIAENLDVGLYAFGDTREELIDEINDQIAMMWDEYVKVDVSDLASDAIELREKLREKIQEVANA